MGSWLRSVAFLRGCMGCSLLDKGYRASLNKWIVQLSKYCRHNSRQRDSCSRASENRKPRIVRVP